MALCVPVLRTQTGCHEFDMTTLYIPKSEQRLEGTDIVAAYYMSCP
jgi:hypothetical protein